MVWQASLLFEITFPFALYLFVFSGSVCSYNFHWFLTPPQVQPLSAKMRWNVTNKHLHLLLAVIGLTGAALAAFLLIEHWVWLGVTAALTFMYSAPMIPLPVFIRLRQIAIGKTIYLAFAWTHITALLPLLIATESLHPVHIWYVVNRFFLLYAICVVFDRRDREGDRQAGIKSLITWLDNKGIDVLFWLLLSFSVAAGLVLLSWLSTAEVAALLVPSFAMGLLYRRSKKSHSDYLYYFLLDGLMAFSAPLLILLRFAR